VATGGYLTPAEFDLTNYILSEWRGAYKIVLAQAKIFEASGISVSDRLPPAPPELKPFKFPFSAIDLAQTAISLAALERNGEKQTPRTIASKYFTDAFDLLVLANDYVDLRPKHDEAMARCHGVTFDEILESNDKNNTRIKFLPGIGTRSGLVTKIREFCQAVRGNTARADSYIAKEFLPVSMLAEIRAWRRSHKRQTTARDGNSP